VKIPGRWLRRFHAYATLVWLGLVVPTVLVWRESVFWVAVMSVWANVASHFGAWQAARAEEAAGDG
jgi:hypothetical protein